MTSIGRDDEGTSLHPSHREGEVWKPIQRSQLLAETSVGPESFEMDENSTKITKRLIERGKCLGLALDTDSLYDDGSYKVSGPFALFSVFLILSVGMLTVKHLDSSLPEALQIKNISNYPDSFIEERARNDLYSLTSIGVRVSGSFDTDSKTVSMILDILRDIQVHAIDTKLEFEVQRPTGAFFRGTEDEHTSAYSKVANVVAKLQPKDSKLATNDSILVNCHFDTKPGSPGATDNMISCVTMLEVIRVFAAEKNTTLRNPIIFLFNGAEELGLQGAHGFIKGYDGPLGFANKAATGHRWSNNLRTVINLEGAGGGGREILFQTGPGNRWTLDAYASAAPYPYAVVVAEEAFQLGLIPSDTDFRIFRDFGNLAGLDMAFAKNGWVYHTKYDKINEIPPGSIQHMGANALAILRHFSSNVDFSTITFNSDGKMVYFDVLGLFMIHYPRWAGMIIDCAIGICSIVGIVFLISKKAESKKSLAFNVVWLPLTAILSWMAGILIAVLVALFFNVCGYYKPFYSYPTLAIVMFGIPAAISQIILQSHALNKSPMQSWMGQKLALALILVIMTFVTRAVYILSINLLFSVISWFFTRYVCRGWPRAISLTYLLIGEFIPFLLSFYLLITLSDTFVPTLGRSGSETNANLFYGVIVAAVVVLLIWNGFCFIFVHFRRRILWLSLLCMFFIGNTLLVFGFIGKIPYQEKTPMRVNIVNVDRTWYELDGVTVNKTEAGYWFWPYDSNTKDFFPTFEKYVPSLSDLQTIEADYHNCQHLYCAQPFLWPMESSVKKTYWLPSNHSIPNNMKIPITLTYRISALSEFARKIEFSLQGPTQFTLVLSPAPSYKLTNWTLTERLPKSGSKWKGRNSYFIFHSRGLEPQTIKFSCEFHLIDSTIKKTDTSLVTVQYSAFYLYGDELMTHEFKNMTEKLPVWVYTMPWTAVMKMYDIKDSPNDDVR